jgi:hypothetical protein
MDRGLEFDQAAWNTALSRIVILSIRRTCARSNGRSLKRSWRTSGGN